MEIDSKPEALDRLERRLIQLKIEREAREEGEGRGLEASACDADEEEIARLEKEYADLEEIWKAEKARCRAPPHIKEEIEQGQARAGERAAQGRLAARWRELQYGKLPELEKRS